MREKSWLHIKIELKPDNSACPWHSRKRTVSAGGFSVKLLPALYTNPDPATCLLTAYSKTPIQKWWSARGSLLIAIRMRGASSSQMTWKEIFDGNKYEIMHTIVLNYNCTLPLEQARAGCSLKEGKLGSLKEGKNGNHGGSAPTAWVPGWQSLTGTAVGPASTRQWQDNNPNPGNTDATSTDHLQHSQDRNMSREGGAVSLGQPLKSPGNSWTPSAFWCKVEFNCRKHCHQTWWGIKEYVCSEQI